MFFISMIMINIAEKSGPQAHAFAGGTLEAHRTRNIMHLCARLYCIHFLFGCDSIEVVFSFYECAAVAKMQIGAKNYFHRLKLASAFSKLLDFSMLL